MTDESTEQPSDTHAADAADQEDPTQPPAELDERQGAGKGEGRKADAQRPADDQRSEPDPKERSSAYSG